MSPFLFTVDKDHHRSRFDRFLTQKFGWSPGFAQKAVRKGWVRVNGKRSKTAQRLELGDTIRITKPGLQITSQMTPATSRQAVPKSAITELSKSIVHLDDEVLVALKDSGIVIHAGTGHPWGLVDALALASDSDFLAPIGRLDRDASGLLVFARNRASARHLDQALRDNQVQRVYTLCALGHPQKSRLDKAITTKVTQGHKQNSQTSENGAPAVTNIAPLSELSLPKTSPASFVQATIETGRTHQIRVHLADHGHPLLGDPRYNTPSSKALSQKLGVDRLMLHAGQLSFPSETGQLQNFQRSLPETFQRIFDRLKGSHS